MARRNRRRPVDRSQNTTLGAATPESSQASPTQDGPKSDFWHAFEYDQYKSERPRLAASESKSEELFDTMVITLGTSGIVTAVTLRDLSQPWLAWTFAFSACALMVGLLDRYLTYRTHCSYRTFLDNEFANYSGKGAMQRAGEALKAQHPIAAFLLPKLKVLALALIAFSVVSLFVGYRLGTQGKEGRTTMSNEKPTTRPTYLVAIPDTSKHIEGMAMPIPVTVAGPVVPPTSQVTQPTTQATQATQPAPRK